MDYKIIFNFLGVFLLVFIFGTCVSDGLIGFIFSLGLVRTSLITVILFVLYKKDLKNVNKN